MSLRAAAAQLSDALAWRGGGCQIGIKWAQIYTHAGTACVVDLLSAPRALFCASACLDSSLFWFATSSASFSFSAVICKIARSRPDIFSDACLAVFS